MFLNRFFCSKFQELSKVTLVLSVSFLSMFTMMFFDRLFLAKYHPQTMSLAVEAGTLAWSFFIGWVTIAGLVEVFVARYLGEGNQTSIGPSVWQGIWFSGFSVIFFLFLGLFGSEILVRFNFLNQENLSYFKLHMYFSPIIVLSNAIGAFYIGKGKAYVVTWMAFAGNVINIVLDPILIFGIPKYIPSLGIQGAAIATSIGYVFQAIVLMFLFLKHKNRLEYQSSNWNFNPTLFMKILRLGAPSAIFVTLEVSSWALFFLMMSRVGQEYSFVTSVCQSIAFLFFCFGLGLEKAAAVVSGKLIGNNKLDEVNRVFLSGLKLIFLCGGVIFLVFLCFSNSLISQFISKNMDFNIEYATNTFSGEKGHYILIFLGIYLFFEYIRYLLSGILAAAGDTFFLMISGVLSIWFFFVLPSYLLIYKGYGNIATAISIWCGYSLLASLVLYLRFYSKKWAQEKVLSKV